jgi:RHS repeat-associated protein
MHNDRAMRSVLGTVIHGQEANPASGTLYMPHRFAGRQWDAESDLYYYRSRYYDPSLGRFISLDTIGIWGDLNNYGNGYAYVGNMGNDLWDPNGQQPSWAPGPTYPWLLLAEELTEYFFQWGEGKELEGGNLARVGRQAAKNAHEGIEGVTREIVKDGYAAAREMEQKKTETKEGIWVTGRDEASYKETKVYISVDESYLRVDGEKFKITEVTVIGVSNRSLSLRASSAEMAV